jgi:DNA-binding transcriptional LysR family regulator
MLSHLHAMAVFAKTVQCGSFRGAAKALNLSPSVVSHHITQLEAALGVALLYRSTRRFSLTHDGEQLLATARAIVETAESGLNQAALRASEPAGHLTITAPAVLLVGSLAEDLVAFTRAYPKVTLGIRATETTIDLIRDGVDLAIRASSAPQNSQLKRKKLFSMARVLVTSPAYLASRTAVRSPDDLRALDWIRLSARAAQVRLLGPGNRSRLIAFEPRVTVDSAQVMLDLASSGLGVAALPLAAAAAPIRRGELVEVLPSWRPEAVPVFAAWPPNAPRHGLALRLVHTLVERHHKTSGRSSGGSV